MQRSRDTRNPRTSPRRRRHRQRSSLDLSVGRTAVCYGLRTSSSAHPITPQLSPRRSLSQCLAARGCWRAGQMAVASHRFCAWCSASGWLVQERSPRRLQRMCWLCLSAPTSSRRGPWRPSYSTPPHGHRHPPPPMLSSSRRSNGLDLTILRLRPLPYAHRGQTSAPLSPGASASVSLPPASTLPAVAHACLRPSCYSTSRPLRASPASRRNSSPSSLPRS
mmetsp:Transcript_13291/g.42691  ORF Transcript_13291/g.42691 Transcript_13291/m.42691 type:complete len:221 (+) Transcript_13291:1020-1682(+)